MAVRWWLAGTVPPLGGREAAAGLGDSVVVVWDSLAVPHIVARSDSDLFFTIGYLHARDRLWQMDLLRHAAEGRLSELFGRATVAADRAQRARETARLARLRAEQLSADARGVVAAYTRGVNAWIERVTAGGGRLPPEFLLLRHRPEPWEARQSVEVALLEAWDLRATGQEIPLARAAARLGEARAAELEPVYPPDGPTIIASPATAAGTPMAAQLPAFDLDRPPGASNSWVLGPGRTRSRKPILANDPHLSLLAPSIWYLLGAHAPGYEVVGVTIPGAPVVVLGHTASHAWGFTNGMVDDVDYVAEQLSPDSSRYRTTTGWAAVETVAETIRVRGGAPVVYRRLRTVHGPLVDVGWRPDSATVYALRWVAQDSSDELTALLRMARAGSRAAFERALETFRSPEQNVVYADTAGTIAYYLAGRVPVRAHGRGDRPTAGWTEEGRWVRYLTTAELPRLIDPAEGFIVTANNKITPPSYPFYISNDWDQPFRAARIREMVRADTVATAASVAREQLDQVDVFARSLAPVVARAATAAGRPDLADRLSHWDARMSPESDVATLFWRWYSVLRGLVYDRDSLNYRPEPPLNRWLLAGRGGWLDDRLDTLSRRAMDSVLAHGGLGPWGHAHTLIEQHPLGGLVWLRPFFRFNVGPLPAGGDPHTVNVCHSQETRPPFRCNYGPSMRHVVDMGDVDGEGGFILPAGESGNPLSKHYGDQTGRWERGELWVVPMDVGRVHAVDTLILRPQEAKTPVQTLRR